jgi:hypothetical protein
VSGVPNNIRGGVFSQSQMSITNLNFYLEKYKVLQEENLLSLVRKLLATSKIVRIIDNDENACAICLEHMTEAVELNRCKHRFHHACLLRISSTRYGSCCPLCRSRGIEIAKKLFTYKIQTRKGTIEDLDDDEPILVSSRMSPVNSKIHKRVCGNFTASITGLVKDFKNIYKSNVLCKKCFRI